MSVPIALSVAGQCPAMPRIGALNDTRLGATDGTSVRNDKALDLRRCSGARNASCGCYKRSTQQEWSFEVYCCKQTA